jgi:hypothetical protein
MLKRCTDIASNGVFVAYVLQMDVFWYNIENLVGLCIIVCTILIFIVRRYIGS